MTMALAVFSAATTSPLVPTIVNLQRSPLCCRSAKHKRTSASLSSLRICDLPVNGALCPATIAKETARRERDDSRTHHVTWYSSWASAVARAPNLDFDR
ncbi:hypothetical protein BDZ85DRAFT_20436 [Elsinoe ampelina]|uniref:Uncharacterized protein n=1 Tax=Elsinoe ampelina TaxID=302913 RepID=A0A6A6G528_9PEZI|nr:hypothetical protein BDZ85DRAFT_20436 [Elsinoe ampelina]